MADCIPLRDSDDRRITVSEAVTAGDLWQLPDGAAGYAQGLGSYASGDQVSFKTTGQVTLTKTSGFVGVAGCRAYWDHSANAVTYKRVNDRDFYCGRFVKDAASGDTTCTVDLNAGSDGVIDLLNSGATSVIVGTAAAGAFGYPRRIGGSHVFELSSTNEAQKVDLLGVQGFAPGANPIVDIVFRVLSDGSGSAADASIGIASATHATDADSIAESLFVHLNANDVNVYLESDDGTTEVAATDTTVDYTEGSAAASQVHVTFDCRDLTDIQCYVNGSLVLGSTVFKLDAATGPLFPLVHLEKTSSTDAYQLSVDRFEVRLMQQ